MRAPKEGGAVYTIAPTTDLGKVKHVHRSLLKAQICQNLPTGLSNSPGAESVQPLEDGYDEEDLFVLVSETPQVRGRSRLQDLVPSLSPTSGDLQAVETCRVTEGTVVEVDLQPVELPSNSLEVGEVAARRTGRRTAGHHSNMHHLPRAVGAGSVSSIRSSTVGTLFRPWN